MDYVIFGLGYGATLMLVGWAIRTFVPGLRYQIDDREDDEDLIAAKSLWTQFVEGLGGVIAVGGLAIVLFTLILLVANASNTVGNTLTLLIGALVLIGTLVWGWMFHTQYGLFGISHQVVGGGSGYRDDDRGYSSSYLDDDEYDDEYDDDEEDDRHAQPTYSEDEDLFGWSQHSARAMEQPSRSTTVTLRESSWRERDDEDDRDDERDWRETDSTPRNAERKPQPKPEEPEPMPIDDDDWDDVDEHRLDETTVAHHPFRAATPADDTSDQDDEDSVSPNDDSNQQTRALRAVRSDEADAQWPTRDGRQRRDDSTR